MSKSPLILLVVMIVMLSGTARAADPELPPIGISPFPERISLQVQDTPLYDVLELLRRDYRLNLVPDADPDLLQNTLVTLNFKDLPFDRALALIGRQAGLRYAFDGNVIYLAPPNRIARYEMTTFRQYNIKDLTVPVGPDGGDDPEEVMEVVVIFTGPDNWDTVDRIGEPADSDDDDDDDTED